MTAAPGRRWWRPTRRRAVAEELLAGPIRGELLGAEGLAERARAMARAQRLRPADEGGRRTPLLTRLDDTRRVLRGTLDDAQWPDFERRVALLDGGTTPAAAQPTSPTPNRESAP